MPHATFQVARVDRQSIRRATLEIVASGLTMDAASALAQALRAQNVADESLFGFSVQSMPLWQQVTHFTAGETMAALREETPLRRVA